MSESITRLPRADELGSARCSDCAFLSAPAHCGLRKVGLPDPTSMCCANHPEFSMGREKTPVGPLVAIAGDSVEVMLPSPDDGRIRDELVESAAQVDVRRAEELTVRERMALWQLVAFSERRAVVHLDRIEASFVPATTTRSILREFHLALFSKIAGETFEAGD